MPGQVTRATPAVRAQRAGPEGHDLKRFTRHHHILEEVIHLVLVGEVAVEWNRRRQREHGEARRDDARLVTAGTWKQAKNARSRHRPAQGNKRRGVVAMVEGLAIAELPEFIATQYFRQERLEPILTDWSLQEGGLYFVMPTARARPAKVSALADFLIAELADAR
jgi:DNA-binding transcriptional LysR family regulator